MTDRVVRVLEPGDPDEASDIALAQEIGDTLQKVYANHPWIISVQGRGIVLRHLSIASEVARVIGREGFSSLLPRESLGTPKEIRQSVVKFAGELLEAFSLPRGPWDGTTPIVPNWNHKQASNFT